MRRALLLLGLLCTGCGGSAPATDGRTPVQPTAIVWTAASDGVRFTTDARALEEVRRLAEARKATPVPSPTASPRRPTPAKLPATLPELRARLEDEAWRDRAGEVAAAMLAAGAPRDEIVTIAARLPAAQARPVRWALARWSTRDGFVALARLRVLPEETPRRELPLEAPPCEALDALLVASDLAACAEEPGPAFVARLAAVSHGLFEPRLVSRDARALRFVVGSAVYEIQDPTVGRLLYAANDGVGKRGIVERFVLLQNGLVVFAPLEPLAVAFDSGLLAPPPR